MKMYNEQDKILMWLASFDFLNYKKAKSIVDNFDLSDLFYNLKNYRDKLLTIITASEFGEMLSNNNLLYINSVLANYQKSNIQVVTIVSDFYPDLLREIASPPIILYCKGDVSLLKSECLAVVGTRRSTRYGAENCTKIIKDVASEGITIVSGLAEGIDTVAHKATLEVSGKTIAVLGGGHNNIYPASNINLANKILEQNGLIVSEYKPSEQALTYHFPIRNRIIAGLSKGVLIVEATEKSGSMHTKNYALDFNREIFAMPGRINDIYSIGCNKIIQSGQAKMLLSSSDLLELYAKSSTNRDNRLSMQLTCDEQLIYSILDGEEKHFDEIAKLSKLETRVLATLLMRMEINGVIGKLSGNHYYRIGEL